MYLEVVRELETKTPLIILKKVITCEPIKLRKEEEIKVTSGNI